MPVPTANMHLLPILLGALSLSPLPGAEAYPKVTYECPKDDFGPCTCLQANGQVFLRCSGLTNRKQLTDAFEGMAGFGITELQIHNSSVSHIPRNLFKESPVTRIRIKNAMMFYLFDRELERGADRLTEIALDHVDFEGGLDWTVLENLKSLKTLTVVASNVENVPYGAHELELPLETLVLESNYIEYVYEFAFQNLKDLKNLKMDKNVIERFNRSMLPLPESGIQFLDLSNNRLKSLPSDAFDGMPDLHSLLLRGNLLKVLEKSYMQNVISSLVFLDVSKNPLVCSCEMTWLLSNPKPFHLFGECKTSGATPTGRNLKDLTDGDFAGCF